MTDPEAAASRPGLPADARQIAEALAGRPMSGRQIGAVAMCCLVNAIDGFDVQATAFTGPSIAAEWALSPEALGLVLSAGLIGMAIGALSLSSLADLLGRRPTALGCLVAIALGMAASGFSHSVGMLVATRIFSGMGIGALISSVGALASEYASDRRRGLVMGVMGISFPAGALLCASTSLFLIERAGWHSVFLAGGMITLAVVPLGLWLLPESLVFVLFSRQPGAKVRANRLLNQLGLPTVTELPTPSLSDQPRWGAKIANVLRGELGWRTGRLALIFCGAMLTFYFLLNWAPKLVVTSGVPLRTGLTIGLLINLGGVAGGLLGGFAIPKWGLVPTGRVALVAMTMCTSLFGALAHRLEPAMALSVVAGITMWGVQTCIYVAMMIAFPSRVRATAVGLVSTGGRVGSVLGPLLGGIALGHGLSASTTCFLLALPALVAAILFAERRATEG